MTARFARFSALLVLTATLVWHHASHSLGLCSLRSRILGYGADSGLALARLEGKFTKASLIQASPALGPSDDRPVLGALARASLKRASVCALLSEVSRKLLRVVHTR